MKNDLSYEEKKEIAMDYVVLILALSGCVFLLLWIAEIL